MTDEQMALSAALFQKATVDRVLMTLRAERHYPC